MRFILTISVSDVTLDARIKDLAKRFRLTQGQVVTKSVEQLERALAENPEFLNEPTIF
jgi:hypothetical protein